MQKQKKRNIWQPLKKRCWHLSILSWLNLEKFVPFTFRCRQPIKLTINQKLKPEKNSTSDLFGKLYFSPKIWYYIKKKSKTQFPDIASQSKTKLKNRKIETNSMRLRSEISHVWYFL